MDEGKNGNPRGRLLLVDDEVAICKSMTRLLSRGGNYIVHSATSGRAGLALLEEEHIDIALIDYRMPEMNGLELFRKIRSISHDLPVIMMTGEGSIELAVKFLKEGGSNFLMKPLMFERLDADLQQAMLVVGLQRVISSLKDEQSKVFSVLETVKTLNNQSAAKIRHIYSYADELLNASSAKDAQQKIRAAAKEIGQNTAAIVKMIAVQKHEER